MKINPGVFFFLAALLFGAAKADAKVGDWQREYDALLRKYVENGSVRYAAWKANSADLAALDRVVTAIGRESPEKLSRNEQLAFYINAYNAWTIRLVLDKYPIKSVKEQSLLWGNFTRKLIRLGGKKMSLNYLEKEIILKRFKDSRAHFAINCASRSCPPLSASAYDGEKLDQELNQRTKSFTMNSLGVQPGKDGTTTKVSRIFKWYEDDFARSGGAREFINQARPQSLPADAKIEYQEYDWGLNEAK